MNGHRYEDHREEGKVDTIPEKAGHGLLSARDGMSRFTIRGMINVSVEK